MPRRWTLFLRNFRAQLKVGRVGESVVESWLSDVRGAVVRAPMVDQLRGIDLYCDGVSIEVKTDTIAHSTGNLAFESVQVDTIGDPGWIWTCQADWLIYLVWTARRAYWFRPEVIRSRALDTWRPLIKSGKVRVSRTDNAAGYVTVCWLVPVADAAALAERVCVIPDRYFLSDDT